MMEPFCETGYFFNVTKGMTPIKKYQSDFDTFAQNSEYTCSVYQRLI